MRVYYHTAEAIVEVYTSEDPDYPDGNWQYLLREDIDYANRKGKPAYRSTFGMLEFWENGSTHYVCQCNTKKEKDNCYWYNQKNERTQERIDSVKKVCKNLKLPS